MDYVREGDALVVTKIDRLARSTISPWDVELARDGKGVSLRVLNLGRRYSRYHECHWAAHSQHLLRLRPV